MRGEPDGLRQSDPDGWPPGWPAPTRSAASWVPSALPPDLGTGLWPVISGELARACSEQLHQLVRPANARVGQEAIRRRVVVMNHSADGAWPLPTQDRSAGTWSNSFPSRSLCWCAMS